MNFTVEQRDRAAIFRPQEPRLDSLLVPELKAEFLILAQPDVEKLIVDLSVLNPPRRWERSARNGHRNGRPSRSAGRGWSTTARVQQPRP